MKKYFPLSYGIKDSKVLIINILKYVLFDIVAGLVIGLATKITGWIPLLGGIIGWLLGIVGTIVGAYALIGIILVIIDYVQNK